MNVRTRCIAGDGSVSVASVTSSMVPSRICAGDVESLALAGAVKRQIISV